jgi:hypothetical protein
LDAIPPLHGKRGRPRHRPDSVLGDRGYDATTILALAVWRMPLSLAGWSVAYGFAVAVWSILWLWIFGKTAHYWRNKNVPFHFIRGKRVVMKSNGCGANSPD